MGKRLFARVSFSFSLWVGNSRLIEALYPVRSSTDGMRSESFNMFTHRFKDKLLSCLYYCLGKQVYEHMVAEEIIYYNKLQF